MNEAYNIILERLEIKKEKLAEEQKCFAQLCRNELKTKCFERNTIQQLAVISELKAAIAELEFCIQLLKNNVI